MTLRLTLPRKVCQRLSAFAPEKVAREAGRVMIKRLRDLASRRENPDFESTKETIREVFQRAVEQAMLEHKRAGSPIAVSENGGVIWTAPEQIPSKPSV